MKKKLIAFILTAALCVGLLAVPAGAAGFPDVTDPAVTQAVEVLQELGVVNGLPDGTYRPGATLTRAEFCKMALTILGRQGEAALQSGRVIFSDVTARHWALGYVNAAAAVKEGQAPLVQGTGDGRFQPDAPITYGQAVALVMRCLGYSDSDVGSGATWYAGYLLRAQEIGLLEGIVSPAGDGPITRANAALLFENMLYVAPKGSSDIFLVSRLGGSVTEPQLILRAGEAVGAGSWAVQTSERRYVTHREGLGRDLVGSMAVLTLDQDKNVLAARADDTYTSRTYRVLSAESRYLVVEGGAQILVDGDTAVWGDHASGNNSTYAAVWQSVAYGSTAVFFYDKAGALSSIYFGANGSDTVTAVAAAGNDPFAAILGDSAVTVYKNGAPAAMADVRVYDVGTYDALAGVLSVSDRKLTGVYENASPSPVSPSTITMMGAEFKVLDCALKDLTGFKLGDPMTLLLDGDGAVAGVVSPKVCSAQALGVAEIASGVDEATGKTVYDAKVTLPYTDGDGKAIVLKGRVSSSLLGTVNAPAKVVGVSSSAAGALTLTELTGEAVPGSWDVKAGKIGSLTLSGDAAIYDQVNGGPLKLVDRADVTLSTVASGRITFLHKNAAGQVDALVLDNVTGEGYTYGVLAYTAAHSDGDAMSYQNATVTAQNSGASLTVETSQDYSKKVGTYIGLAPTLQSTGGAVRMADLITLRTLAVRRSAFGDGVVTVNGVEYPLAADIDSHCYNAKAKTFFPSLADALAFSSRLTICYDKAPSQGGKVRMVVAE